MLLQTFRQRSSSGFTLLEMVISLTIIGIVVAMGAAFIRFPVQGYMNSVRSSGLIDITDSALRSMHRDFSSVIPNSIRMPDVAGSSYVEFLPMSGWNNYLPGPPAVNPVEDCTGYKGDKFGGALAFSDADTCFVIIGPSMLLTRGATDDLSDQIVVGSALTSGDPPYDKTYVGNGVRRPYVGETAVKRSVIIIEEQFPAFAQVEGNRFQVISGDTQAITYACESVGVDGSGDGTGTLKRYWLYSYNSAQQAPPLTGSSSLLLSHISSCTFAYENLTSTVGIVKVSMEVAREGETVELHELIHVDNTP